MLSDQPGRFLPVLDNWENEPASRSSIFLSASQAIILNIKIKPGWACAIAIKMPIRTLTSYTRVSAFNSQLCS